MLKSQFKERCHSYYTDFKELVRAFVDGVISETEYRKNLSIIVNNYRNDRKELF